jgi:precorrin-6A/cobalt-precorrin-6A reductase
VTGTGTGVGPPLRVMLLAGTAEARELATLLVTDGVEVTTSLAGRLEAPRAPVGDVRLGGFGGVDGLRTALDGYDAVIDATHPFAAAITANAAAACAQDPAVPLLRLQRPGWCLDPTWRLADSHEEAATATASLGRRPFLTVGRQELPRYVTALGRHAVLVRTVEPPALDLPTGWRVVTDRGPFTVDGDLAVLLGHAVDVLVTKDSGGTATSSKLEAAQRLGVPVVVVRRPATPPGVPTVPGVDAARTWVAALPRLTR